MDKAACREIRLYKSTLRALHDLVALKPSRRSKLGRCVIYLARAVDLYERERFSVARKVEPKQQTPARKLRREVVHGVIKRHK